MFADLTSRQQRQVYRSALRKGAGILVGETKRQLRQTLGRAASSRNRCILPEKAVPVLEHGGSQGTHDLV